MIEITGLPDVVPHALLEGLSPGALHQVMYNIADAARAEWLRLAGQTYFTTRRTYQKGISKVRIGHGMATISLVGDLPNMLEQGMKARDLHDTLLGPNVPLVPLGQRGKHPSADGGEYRAIPFRHATPTAGGAVGMPMGLAYGREKLTTDVKGLGKEIYDLALGLRKEPTIGEPFNKVAYGARLGAEGLRKVFASRNLPEKLRDEHAVGIYEGMIYSQKTYESEKPQGFYMTFRTIAKDAQEQPVGTAPWKTKERKGDFLHKRVSAYIQEIAEGAVKAYIKELG